MRNHVKNISKTSTTIMPSYRCRPMLVMTLHFIGLLSILPCYVSIFSIYTSVVSTGDLLNDVHFLLRRYNPDVKYVRNVRFTKKIISILFFVVAFTLYSILSIENSCPDWLSVLIIRSGDVQPNPGPSVTSQNSINSDSSFSSCTSSFALANHFSIVHYNVQSLLPKLDNLSIELKDFDILTFSETWLNDSIHSDDLTIPSFSKPERKDRMDGYGGVCIYVKNTLAYKRMEELEFTGIESIWIEVTMKQLRILVGVFYRPPNSNYEYWSKIDDSIHLAMDSRANDIIVLGDFNFNMLNHQSSSKISSLCQQLGLFQLIKEPTHFTENTSSLIDIMLVNNTNSLIQSGVSDPFLNQQVRYHCPIYGIFKYTKPKITSYKRIIWNYDKGDYDLLRHNASLIHWSTLENDDLDTYTKQITDKILELTKQAIPNKHVTIKPSEPNWITSFIKRKIRSRKRAYRKARRSNRPNLWEKFKKLRNEVVSLIRSAKQEQQKKIANKLVLENLSPRDMWKTLKSIITDSNKQTIPTLVHQDIIASSDIDKANTLNNFFAMQSLLLEDNAIVPHILPSQSTLSVLVFTVDEVRSVLQSLPLGKASGPDQINNRILREMSKELSNTLCDLFNKSLSTASLPSSWKEAHVCAVFKKGDPAIVSNYRPISLLSNIDKVLERLVFKHVYNFLLDNNFLTSFQSGFIPGDSTVNQLTFIYNTFCKALDDGKEVRAVFFDISKAFDRVWHRGLLAKLQGAGIGGRLLEWFSNYLADRKQRVIIPGVKSNWAVVKAGVPQGSILGPLLFLVYINDIVSDIQSNIRLFADDTSLYLIVEHANVSAATLNSDIKTITEWAKTWLVSFNPTKTESLLISRKMNRDHHPSLSMMNQDILEVQSHRHLGVTLSNDGGWHSHIEYIKSKAWPRINIMKKLKFVLDRKSLERIYFCFIRPILEYADVTWDNCTQHQKDELDKIQNEAARIVTGTTKLVSIRELNNETKWETLESRRQKHKLILFYKMVNQLTPAYLSTLVPPLVSEVSSYNLRNSQNLSVPSSRTKLYAESFLPSVVHLWNSLPQAVRDSESVNSFKNSLDQHSVSKPPSYYYTGCRKAQILHTRMRTNCSSLNLTLFHKNITESPLCQCGSIESAEHYLLFCPMYQNSRIELLNSINPICRPSSKIMLFGDTKLSLESNNAIFSAVQEYITKTKRFCN